MASGDAGSFNAGATTGVGAVTGTPLPFENPTLTGPLTHTVVCVENADVPIQFDVTLMRPAQQGFFDIAVSFDDVFCSAKFDCCNDANDDGACAGDGSEDHLLLANASGERDRTYVLALACTAGVDAAVQTDLYLDALELDCTPLNSGADFAADLRVDVASGPTGNRCAVGDLSGCAIISEVGGTDADDYLYQVATYRGTEDLTSGGVPARKAYWNVALGVNASISSCRLRTRATADDAANAADGVVNGTVAAGWIYPYIRWDVDLGTCGSEPLTFGDASAPVTAVYTRTDGSGLSFAYHYLAGAQSGGFCTPACLNGGVCVTGVCDCSATAFEGPNCAQPLSVIATGGDESDIVDGGLNYRMHTFNQSDTFTVTRGGQVEYLVVAGGGAGGAGFDYCGGGGGGGVVESTVGLVPSDYAVVVGDGGAASGAGPGGAGGASSFAGIVADGGGGGCSGAYTNGGSGGSGGGGCPISGVGGLGTSGQGFQGGSGSGGDFANGSAGGGGGAGGPAQRHGPIGPTNAPGIAGPPFMSTISGVELGYACGGNGAGYYASSDPYGIGGGTGGVGGAFAPTAGMANRGAGGGGGRQAQSGASSSASGAHGGSGVVIVRYRLYP